MHGLLTYIRTCPPSRRGSTALRLPPRSNHAVGTLAALYCYRLRVKHILSSLHTKDIYAEYKWAQAPTNPWETGSPALVSVNVGLTWMLTASDMLTRKVAVALFIELLLLRWRDLAAAAIAAAMGFGSVRLAMLLLLLLRFSFPAEWFV